MTRCSCHSTAPAWARLLQCAEQCGVRVEVGASRVDDDGALGGALPKPHAESGDAEVRGGVLAGRRDAARPEPLDDGAGPPLGQAVEIEGGEGESVLPEDDGGVPLDRLHQPGEHGVLRTGPGREPRGDRLEPEVVAAGEAVREVDGAGRQVGTTVGTPVCEAALTERLGAPGREGGEGHGVHLAFVQGRLGRDAERARSRADVEVAVPLHEPDVPSDRTGRNPAGALFNHCCSPSGGGWGARARRLPAGPGVPRRPTRRYSSSDSASLGAAEGQERPAKVSSAFRIVISSGRASFSRTLRPFRA